MPVLMVDVAKRAGVSVTMVSRVMNQNREIAPETRQRVFTSFIPRGASGRIGKAAVPVATSKSASAKMGHREHSTLNLVSSVQDRQDRREAV